MNFLKKATVYLHKNYKEEISKLFIITPNKRSILFIRKHLSNLIDKTIFMPEIITLKDFLEYSCKDKFIASKIMQSFLLYSAYKKVIKDDLSYQNFIDIGDALIKDFNEIDAYLLDQNKIFTYLKNIKQIENWEVSKDSDFQDKFIVLWENAGKIYEEFKAQLTSKNFAYSGMLAREVAEKIKANPEKFIEDYFSQFRKIIFIGFNALSNSEETIISNLIKQKKAEIYWDTDKFFLDNKFHQSGYFLRKLQGKRAFQPINWISDNFSQKKDISIHSFPSSISQLQLFNKINLNTLADKDFQETAIILTDESLLLPTLEFLPESIKNVNVTMGYPYSKTHTNSFVESYLKMLILAKKISNKNYGERFYHKSFLEFIQHPISTIIFNQDKTHKAINYLKELSNDNTIDEKQSKEIVTMLGSSFWLLSTKNNTPEKIITVLLRFIELIKINKQQTDPLELENLFELSKILNQIKNLNDEKYKLVDSLESFYEVYKKLSFSYTTDLFGEPLKGLQIMGVLETRGLSFKNLIVLSANEGIFPKKRGYQSHIPNDVRREFGLPTFQNTEAIYSYHFYRLIKEAKTIHLAYFNTSSDFSGTEKSRYLLQLENDLKNKPNISLSKFNYKFNLNPISKEIEVKSNPTVVNTIIKHLEKGISPSAINVYTKCPHDFYLKYILGVKEKDVVQKDFSIPKNRGNILHQLMEDVYSPFKKQEISITEKEILAIKKNLNSHLKKAIKTACGNVMIQGENLIIYEMMLKLLHSFFDKEKNYIQESSEKELKIKGLEEKVEYILKTPYKEKEINIRLKGQIDRIDSINGISRVIDYKTGKVADIDLKIKEISDLSEKEKVFQMSFYAYLTIKNNLVDGTSSPELYIYSLWSVNNIIRPIFLPEEKKGVEREYLEEFENYLKEIFITMIDENNTFKHNPESKYCLCHQLI